MVNASSIYNYDTNGIWVGKFETGYKGATSTTGAEQNLKDATKVIIKPNTYSWRNINVSNALNTAVSYAENLNSHMMRNTEWGAVAYLSHSKYGINDEVRINNHSNYLTGYAANTKDASASTTNNSAYNTKTGYLASTTGNITGVYDMSGGSYEYVAGYVKEISDSSGFTTNEITIYLNHLDIYPNNSKGTTFNNRILGDATGEIGPFYRYLNGWYKDRSAFAGDSSYPWFVRGGCNHDGQETGQFCFGRHSGTSFEQFSFRITLAFNN